MATTEFTRTQTAGTSTKKFTVSMWVKRGGDLGGYPTLFSCGTGSSDGFNLAFTNNDFLILEAYDGSANPKLETTRTFRDVGAWYHLVVAFDCTLAAAGDRLRIYINGVEETSFVTETNQNILFTKAGLEVDLLGRIIVKEGLSHQRVFCYESFRFEYDLCFCRCSLACRLRILFRPRTYLVGRLLLLSPLLCLE